MDLGYLPEVVRNDLIDFDSIPDKAKEVLALRCIGMGSTKISRVLKITKKSVEGYMSRYDPNSECKVDADMKRKITSEMLMQTGVSALLEITDEKLQALDADKLATVATRCVNTAEKIRMLDKGLKKPEAVSRIDTLMDSIEIAEVIEE